MAIDRRSKGGGKPEPPDADAAAWRALTRSVDPLKGREIPDAPAHDASRPKDASTPAADSPRRAAPLRRVPPPPAALDHGTIAGVDRRTGARFKRGQMPIEARIDLHGMTQGDAHRALDAFIAGAHDAGRRCVLVITGKGLTPDGSIGVLRANVPRWLNEPALRACILAFTYAQPKDGGQGALYVLLKKHR